MPTLIDCDFVSRPLFATECVVETLEYALHLPPNSAKSGPETKMKRKHERQAAKLLIEKYFDKVAEFPFVVNKWISINVWYDLIVQKVDNEFGAEISQSYFKRTLIAFEKVSKNLSLPSSHGFYYCKARLSKGGRAQTTFRAIYVTEPWQLPQLSPMAIWSNDIITAIPPSWSTQARVLTPPLDSLPRDKQPRNVPSVAAIPSVDATIPSVNATIPNITNRIIPNADTIVDPNFVPAPTTNHQFQTSYWHSPKAKKYFGYHKPKNKEDEEKPVRDVIYERMILFRNAALTPHGWRNILDDADVDNVCPALFILVYKKSVDFFILLLLFYRKIEKKQALT